MVKTYINIDTSLFLTLLMYTNENISPLTDSGMVDAQFPLHHKHIDQTLLPDPYQTSPIQS